MSLRTWACAAAGIALVAALAGLGSRAAYGARTSGDEPYYLLTALSLGTDGDLELGDEIADDAYRPFHEIPLDQQSAPVGGRLLSPHDPLLAVLLAPAMALGGWVAAKAALAVLAALLAAGTVWLAVRRGGVTPWVAGVVVASFAAGVPLAPYGTQVYPEVAAALATVVAVGAASAPRPGRRGLLVAAAAVVALPWLGVKYVPVAAAVMAVAAWRAWRAGGRRAVLGTAALLTAAGAVYLAAHQAIWGGWTVYAAGDHFTATGELSVVGTAPDYLGRARRLVGLLVDREHGLIPWAPAWLALPAGVAAVAVRSATHAALRLPLLATLAAGWLTAAFVALTMHGWWVPGRQVVVVLPLAVVGVAVLVERWRWLLAPLAAASALGATSWLWLAREAASGGPTLIVDFAETSAPGYRALAGLFPAGRMGAAADDRGLVIWALLLGGLAVTAWLASRAEAGVPAARLLRRLPSVAIAAVVAVTTGALVAGLVRLVDGREVLGALHTAAGQPLALMLALGSFAAAFWARALAWTRLLPGLGLGQASAAIHVALGANHVLPLRLGEPLRIVSAVRRSSVGWTEAAASTVALRSADVVVLLVLGGVAGPTVLWDLVGAWALGAAVVVAALGAGFAVHLRRRTGRLPGAPVLALTGAAWLLEAVLVWQCARWFGLDLGPAEAVVVLAAAVSAQLLALTPGGIGTYEAAAAAALAAVGVPLTTGLAVALTVHATKTAYSLVAGALAVVIPTPGLLGRWRLPATLPDGGAAMGRPAAAGAAERHRPVVLFLPAHDEEGTVADVVRRAPAQVGGHPVEVVVVDDGSRDRTAVLARHAGAHVLAHDANRGLGAAVRSGLAWAVERKAAAVAFCDADGEYDPAQLDRLVQPILCGRADYVVGSRFAGDVERMHPHRRLGNIVLTAWLRWTVRAGVTDGQSGYRALSPAAASAATIPHDYNYAQVLTVDLLGKGFAYAEVPITYAFRSSGDSFVRLGRYLRAVIPAVWRQLNPA
ncbi:MAG: flippase-like domain-containing protein [Actinobacteria bacterium]|nr:flippase-like domain-containing protein [Actinomycetota bacterium]